MHLPEILTERSLIVALAILGAVVATAGSMLGRRGASSAKLARALVRSGYIISFASVALFIVAGFLKGR